MPSSLKRDLFRWFDTHAELTHASNDKSDLDRVNWVRTIPFIVLHLACLAVIWVGWSPVAVIVALLFYVIRMIGITAFYHRYFAHKTYKAGRFTQFVFAVIGCSATQRGPLWWAAHHRHHHHHSDQIDDVHSPKKGFFWSHMGWFLSDTHYSTRLDLIPDFARFRELVFLDRFDMIIPLASMAAMYVLGALLQYFFPAMQTSGLQMLVWGYVISTVVLMHATFCINSIAHVLGSRRFETGDTSRNNLILALFTFGEGWHNNHHRFPSSARQGIRWWEIDPSYYLILLLQRIGLVWNVNSGPSKQQIERALKPA